MKYIWRATVKSSKGDELPVPDLNYIIYTVYLNIIYFISLLNLGIYY